MGCFDVACALTNTPIKTWEKCYLVILPEDMPWAEIIWLASSEARWGIAAKVFYGEYSDYGSVDPKGKLSKADAELLDTFRDCDREYEKGALPRLHFFISDTAWDWCQEKFKDWIPYEIKERREHAKLYEKEKGGVPSIFKDPPGVDQKIALARVMRAFSAACKHPLAGIGCYHQYDEDIHQGIRENAALAEKRMKTQEEWLERECGPIDPETGYRNG